MWNYCRFLSFDDPLDKEWARDPFWPWLLAIVVALLTVAVL